MQPLLKKNKLQQHGLSCPLGTLPSWSCVPPVPTQSAVAPKGPEAMRERVRVPVPTFQRVANAEVCID